MNELPLPADKTAAELRAEFLALYEQVQKIRSKLDEITDELAAHEFLCADHDPALTDIVEFKLR